MTQLDMKHIERVLQHLPRSYDLTLVALKGHLLIEELLDEIIWAHCKSPESLQDVEIRFPAKIKLVLALTGTHELSMIWSLCEKLNSLRNSLAHKIEHPAAQKKLRAFFGGFGNDFDWRPTSHDASDLWSGIAILIGAIQGVRNPLVLKASGVAD
ncbi:hypothetical protein [Lysobacter sp. M2-1]|uniref:hypothetical protein n=1 Tax=Lysobacter sp. M2-1 TaxID=2916839 RepID=UPI001F55B0A8|nr:hypothetical protein [Lysobacter sp. M2-1]